MEWPAAPDTICQSRIISKYELALKSASKLFALPLLPHHKFYTWGAMTRQPKSQFENRHNLVVDAPVYFGNYADYCYIPDNEVFEYIVTFMGRGVKGLLLHQNMTQSVYPFPWAAKMAPPHFLVDVKDAHSYTLQELRAVDFVVAIIWRDTDQAIQLLNAIGKPVFWFFNENELVIPSIHVSR
jgi:hypothetical protein